MRASKMSNEMLKLKRKARRIAAWTQLQQGLAGKQPRNWNLTQQLYKSNAEQLHQELRFLLIICVLFGSVPFAVLPHCTSRMHDVVQHCWLFLLYVWLCFSAYLELSDSSGDLNNLERNFYIFESITYLIHIACIIIISLSWKRRIGQVFDTIGKFDLASGYIVKRKKIRRFVHFQLLLLLIFISCTIPIVFFNSVENFWKSWYNWNTYVVPNTLTSISFVLYYTLMEGICRRLKCLVKSLHAELQRGIFIRRAALQELRLQHRSLLHFTKIVNQTFGLSILLLYASSLINFNTNLFLFYKAIENSTGAHWNWWAYNNLFLLMHTCKMFCLLYFNHNVQREQLPNIVEHCS
ncbi:putative gustatory receptor 59f isoform X2 [Drosophila hydei]|uniref:Gustatory receptor n=1 Tax=Drosophila hydei TaxID=7224 RepID=A0A6J1MDI8_DROHY|nr:putative gustatory receptor 59f isoform X2 [Drosophila hydei]